MCPEQIFSLPSPESQSSLIDEWGRVHDLPEQTTIGRESEGNNVVILHSSVSRSHARIWKTREGWHIKDLKSTNGTSVNTRKIQTTQKIDFGTLLTFGDIDFFFVENKEGPKPRPDEQVSRTAPSSLPGSNGNFELYEPKGGGGGLVKIEEKLIKLSMSQFELIALLANRLHQEKNEPELVRGFVRSSVLLSDLSWDTPHPTDANVKQLIRRIRHSFARSGIENVIESQHGLGYRLKIPE